MIGMRDRTEFVCLSSDGLFRRMSAGAAAAARLAALAVSLLAGSAAAQQPQQTGSSNAEPCSVLRAGAVLVIDGVGSILANAPGDRVRISATASVQGPWFEAGARDLARSLAPALASAGEGRPSLVIACIDNLTLGWRWNDRATLSRVGADPRSWAVRTAIGVKSLDSVLLSRSVASAAGVYVRGAISSAALQSVQSAVRARWRGASCPVVVVGVSAGAPPAVADLLASVAAGSGVLRANTSSVSSIASALQASQGAQASSGASGTSGAPIPVASSVPAAGAPASPSPSAPGSAGSASGPATGSSGSGQAASPGQVQQSTAVADWRSGPDGSWVAIDAGGNALTEPWQPVTVSVRDGFNGRVAPTASVERLPGGLRVTYTYRNTTAAPAELCSLKMPLAPLGQAVVTQDFCEIGSDLPLTTAGGGWSGAYPQVLYSPTAVVRGATTALGVSVEYPVLAYRHEVRLSVVPEGSNRWWVEVGFNNAGLTGGITYLFNKPMLAPGEARTYVVNVLFAEQSRWEDSLAPYRDFFRATYGGVRYSRDPRPIAGISLAYGEYQTQGNPDGWIPEASRPDKAGFGAAAATIERQFNRADRVLVWAPTGLTMPQSLNFPFQFASRWLTGRSAMSDAPQRLSAIAARPGRNLGLWWGHSASPSTAWSGGQPVALDANDPACAALCAAELNAARAAGATLIGLDAFAHCIVPVWRLVPQLAAMKTSFQEMTFCTEGRAPDVLHALAATWIDGFRYHVAADRDEFVAAGRFRIADYLLPGHETWVGMSFDRSRNPALWGTNFRQSDRDDFVRVAIQRGFVPVVWTDADLRGVYSAALSSGQTP
jgi:hypothetical protein